MSDDETAPKRHRGNPLSKSRAAANDMSVSELAALMKSQFSSYQRSTKSEIENLGNTIATQMDKLRNDIAADLDKIRDENSVTFKQLSSSIEKNRTNCINSVDRVVRINDLIVSGVPYVQGEDLMEYFRKWCISLGYTEVGIPHVDIRRLAKGVPVVGRAYTLLIQFAITIQRDDFFGRYLRSRSLCLSGIGFNVSKRIFINENLGTATRDLKTKALQLRKAGVLTNVFSRNGIIIVKKAQNGLEIAITSEDDLNLLTHQN